MEAGVLPTRNGGQKKTSMPGSPLGPHSVSVALDHLKTEAENGKGLESLDAQLLS